MKLYVGNLPYSVAKDELEALFSQHGEVVSVNIITDRDTGQQKGFGFVEFKDKAAAENAIKELDGKDFEGRPLKVNEAKPREPRAGGGGYNKGGGRGDRGGRW